VVPERYRTATVGLVEHAADSGSGWTYRQPFMAVDAWQENTVGKAGSRPAPLLAKAKPRTQYFGRGMQRVGGPKWCHVLVEGVDIGGHNIAERDAPLLNMVEEPSDLPSCGTGGLLGQPPTRC
jgi:hypothetical protein